MKKKVSKPEKPLKGSIVVPSDKSISHRAVIFASLAKGRSIIKNFSKSYLNPLQHFYEAIIAFIANQFPIMINH